MQNVWHRHDGGGVVCRMRFLRIAVTTHLAGYIVHVVCWVAFVNGGVACLWYLVLCAWRRVWVSGSVLADLICAVALL
jgi:hypothetical protein